MYCLRLLLPLLVFAAFIFFAAPASTWASTERTDQARKFLHDHEAVIRPLEIAANIAWWDANTSGKDEDFKKKEEAQNHLDEALADKKMFAQVKELNEHRQDIEDSITARAIHVIYLARLEKQVDPALLKKIVRSEERRVGKECRSRW